MKRSASLRLAFLLIFTASTHTYADPARANRGHDPFFQISKAIDGCPAPLGPLETEQEWLDDSHYRIERGNSCWVEGRCRLPNGYLYDTEIAEAVQRRLTNINYATHWREQSTLWLTLQRRFIYVEGCVAPGFDKQTFLNELGKTADVERVIDNTTPNPKATQLPYKTLADPDRPVLDPGN
ncbi:hypothetical protein LFL96_30185 [Paraburkholderia sp. D15]|uniref:hypothetical protein n=1 Tax=Paraburkholderia sp. D15 TaxID=2880218 RepID=UPI00247ACBA2|nr:hypothetical protein [Paraburkholderia sp. D15]WGS52461.1 hypothetical protein LFL96_30185 [Paraburkholderia sp. D15]